MLPLAPGRLSTTNCWPVCSLTRFMVMRVTTSTAPPAANGRMSRTGFTGQSCADAEVQRIRRQSSSFDFMGRSSTAKRDGCVGAGASGGAQLVDMHALVRRGPLRIALDVAGAELHRGDAGGMQHIAVAKIADTLHAAHQRRLAGGGAVAIVERANQRMLVRQSARFHIERIFGSARRYRHFAVEARMALLDAVDDACHIATHRREGHPGNGADLENELAPPAIVVL